METHSSKTPPVFIRDDFQSRHPFTMRQTLILSNPTFIKRKQNKNKQNKTRPNINLNSYPMLAHFHSTSAAPPASQLRPLMTCSSASYDSFHCGVKSQPVCTMLSTECTAATPPFSRTSLA